MSRLKERYQETVIPSLVKEFGYANVMAVPKVKRVVVNMGLGEATQNVKLIDAGTDDLTRIAGQKPLTTKSLTREKTKNPPPFFVSSTKKTDLHASRPRSPLTKGKVEK